MIINEGLHYSRLIVECFNKLVFLNFSHISAEQITNNEIQNFRIYIYNFYKNALYRRI